MHPSDPFILRAYTHWESGYYQKKMDCQLQVCFPETNQSASSLSEVSPIESLSTLSFSVPQIARLANTYHLPEGFLNYLQRIRFEHVVDIQEGRISHLDALLSLKASAVDFLLFAERLEFWAKENLETLDGQMPQLRWIFSFPL